MSRSRAHARRPVPEQYVGHHQVDSGSVELVPDRSDPDGWSVMVNGVPSSYLRLDDPRRLDFEYMRWSAHVLDTLADESAPIRAVHLGGAGCTLAHYVAATRPGSRQDVFEIDAALVTLMRQAFALRSVPGLRLRTADGRDGLVSVPAGEVDVVIRDAFAGASVPEHLTTVEFHQAAARALNPHPATSKETP